MAQAEGIDEKLKAKDQMAWGGRMSSLRPRAEEIILEKVFLHLITDDAPSPVDRKISKRWRFHMPPNPKN